MSWIRMAVAGLALCAGASVARAQGAQPQGGPQGGQQGGGMRGGRGMQMLLQGITLTDAQQAKVTEITTKARERMQGMMQAGGPPDPSMREKMTESREKQEKAIREVLTADQRKIFDANVAEAKKRREEGGMRGPGNQD